MTYEELKLKHPDLNWKEAEESSDDELEAASISFDRLNNELMNKAEIYTKLTGILEDTKSDDICIHLCNFFDTDKLEKFYEFLEDELNN